MPRRTLLLALAMLVAGPCGSSAQDRWHGWESVGGAALGATSGAVVGSMGSLIPCNDTYAGPHCVRWVAGGAALVGGVSGAIVGGRDPEMLGHRAFGAAIGLGAGTALGLAMAPFIERWAMEDVLALGVIGGAVGSAPLGAVIGLGVGAVSGAALWQAVPGFGSPDGAAFVLGGITLGVLTEWIVRAATAGDDAQPAISLGYHVRF